MRIASARIRLAFASLALASLTALSCTSYTSWNVAASYKISATRIDPSSGAIVGGPVLLATVYPPNGSSYLFWEGAISAGSATDGAAILRLETCVKNRDGYWDEGDEASPRRWFLRKGPIILFPLPRGPSPWAPEPIPSSSPGRRVTRSIRTATPWSSWRRPSRMIRATPSRSGARLGAELDRGLEGRKALAVLLLGREAWRLERLRFLRRDLLRLRKRLELRSAVLQLLARRLYRRYGEQARGRPHRRQHPGPG